VNGTSPLVTSLIYSGIPTAFAIAGTALATIWRPNDWVHSGLLHLAAGVLFATIGVEMLPRITSERDALGWILGGFICGLVIMLATRRLEKLSEQKHKEKQAGAPSGEGAAGGARMGFVAWPWGILTSNSIDQIIDGALLGVGIVASQQFGLMLSITATIEDLTLAVAIAAMLTAVGAARWQILSTIAALGALLIVVSVVGTLVAGSLTPQIIAFLISVSSAALLYSVTEQLITQAHDVATGPILASVYFAGFLIILTLGMV
jgi:zinc transporter, ZIP family